jgi:hypothetical protein
MLKFLKKSLPFTLYPLPFVLPNPAYAAPDLGPGPAGVEQAQQLMTRIINLSVGAAFIAVTVVLVWAGIKYITSGGEQKSILQAHNTVTWAFLGLVFMALAWLVLKLIAAFTGVDVTQFRLSLP